MTKKINYEDDIFTLSLLVRTLRDIMKLEIDPEFFRERITADINYLDGCINRIYQTLTASPFFLKRSDHLKAMQRLKRSFGELLDDISLRRVPCAEFLADQAERCRGLSEAHARDASAIRSSLAQPGSFEEEHIVSEDEFRILMSPQEEETEKG
jgi:hypothetical protein